MNTAEEVISKLQELPPEERQKVADFLNSYEGDFLQENYLLKILPNWIESKTRLKEGLI